MHTCPYTHIHTKTKKKGQGELAETRKGISKNEKGTRKSHNETLYVQLAYPHKTFLKENKIKGNFMNEYSYLKCFHSGGGIPSPCHVHPHPLTCSFHGEEYGHLTTWQWVSHREQSKSKYSNILGRPCKVYMVKSLQKQTSACPRCCVYQSGSKASSHLTGLAVGQIC